MMLARPFKQILVTALTLAVVSGIPACATYNLADEPADLIAKGRTIEDLIKLGWEISEPVDLAELNKEVDSKKDPSYTGKDYWKEYIDQMVPGDEIRRVRNNAGIGTAIFRAGHLIDMNLPTIF